MYSISKTFNHELKFPFRTKLQYQLSDILLELTCGVLAASYHKAQGTTPKNCHLVVSTIKPWILILKRNFYRKGTDLLWLLNSSKDYIASLFYQLSSLYQFPIYNILMSSAFFQPECIPVNILPLKVMTFSNWH